MYHVGDESRKKFYQMFQRTEKMVQDDVHNIKEWLKTQRHLPEIMGDTEIRNFLHMNKFSVEKAKGKIDMYYTLRSLLPDMFVNPRAENIQVAFNTLLFCTFPKLLDGLHRIHMWKWKQPNSAMEVEEGLLFLAVYEVRLHEDFFTDDVVIIDWKNVTLNDIKKWRPSFITKFFNIYRKIFAMRLYKAYYVNCPSYVSLFSTVVKAVMKPKIFERIHFYPDDKILKEIFPIDELPKDYGGNGPSVQELTDMTKRKVYEYQERFDFLEKAKVDESLRPEKLNNDEILGFYGNFKNVDFD